MSIFLTPPGTFASGIQSSDLTLTDNQNQIKLGADESTILSVDTSQPKTIFVKDVASDIDLVYVDSGSNLIEDFTIENSKKFTDSITTGDCTGTHASGLTVQSVGGKTAADIADAVDEVEAATSANTADTLVKRDANGDFSCADISCQTIQGHLLEQGSLIGNYSVTYIKNAVDDVYDATSANTADTIVKRDANGDFSANDVTAANFHGDLSATSNIGSVSVARVEDAVEATEQASITGSAFKLVKYNADGEIEAPVDYAALAANVENVGSWTVGVFNAYFQKWTRVSNTGVSNSDDIRVRDIIADRYLYGDLIGDLTGNVYGNVIGDVTGDLTGNADTATSATSFTGTLSGDVTGTQGATVVSQVGAKTASQVSTATSFVDSNFGQGAGVVILKSAFGLQRDNANQNIGSSLEPFKTIFVEKITTDNFQDTGTQLIVSSDVLPSVNNTDDLGSSSKKFAGLHVTTANAATANITTANITTANITTISNGAFTANGNATTVEGSNQSFKFAIEQADATRIFFANTTLSRIIVQAEKLSIRQPGGGTYCEFDGTDADLRIYGANKNNKFVVENANGDAVFRVDTSSGGGEVWTTRIEPHTDNTYDLGSLGLRWDDVYATNGTIQTSDERLKKDIQNTALGLDFIEKLRPVSFVWKNGVRPHQGLIAQEVEEVLDGEDHAMFIRGKVKEKRTHVVPAEDEDDEDRVITEYIETDDERLGLRYTELIAPIIKAVQQLAEENRALVARVAELEATL